MGMLEKTILNLMERKTMTKEDKIKTLIDDQIIWLNDQINQPDCHASHPVYNQSKRDHLKSEREFLFVLLNTLKC